VDAVQELLGNCRRHAFLVYVALPLFTLALWWVPLLTPLKPTCERGYSNYTLIIVALLVCHHICAEGRAWTAAKQLLARPELTVMHHLGVLKKRRILVLLGILEDLVIYTDLAFPFVAFSCDITLTDVWLESWMAVPIIGKATRLVLVQIRFWGFSSILVSLVCLVGISGLIWQTCTEESLLDIVRDGGQTPRQIASRSTTSSGSGGASSLPRLGGEQFLQLARAAENAAMPSVAELCEEMAQQRRWVFDDKKADGGARAATKLRESAVFGQATRKIVEAHELYNEEERRSLNKAQMAYFAILLMGKVLLGNALQLWLQASFFGLALEVTGTESMVKLIIGMVFGTFQILMRCHWACQRLGCWGVSFVALNFFIVFWAAAKIYFAFVCKDHVWNLTTQCLDMPNNSTNVSHNVTS